MSLFVGKGDRECVKNDRRSKKHDGNNIRYYFDAVVTGDNELNS